YSHVKVFEVEVRDAFMVITEECHGVATRIGVMADVETQVQQTGISQLQQALDLRFVLDGGVRVRMKDGLDSAALCVVGEAVQVFADARPAAVIELEFAVCEAFVEQNDVVGVQLCQQVTQGGGSVAHLVPAVRGVEVARKRA